MTTFEKVAEILAEEKDLDKAVITMDSTWADLELDSLDTVELVMRLEDDFGVSIEMDENIKTVGNVVELIDAAL